MGRARPDIDGPFSAMTPLLRAAPRLLRSHVPIASSHAHSLALIISRACTGSACAGRAARAHAGRGGRRHRAPPELDGAAGVGHPAAIERLFGCAHGHHVGACAPHVCGRHAPSSATNNVIAHPRPPPCPGVTADQARPLLQELLAQNPKPHGEQQQQQQQQQQQASEQDLRKSGEAQGGGGPGGRRHARLCARGCSQGFGRAAGGPPGRGFGRGGAHESPSARRGGAGAC